MVILLLSIIIVGILLFSVLKKYWVIGLIVIFSVLPIGIVFALHSPPVSNYQYSAQMTMVGDDSIKTIYFNDFNYDNGKVIIDEYATQTIHFTDFESYEINSAKLTITLLDNDGKFLYTDRATKEVINQNNNAVQ